MDVSTTLSVGLIAILLVFSLDFDRHYSFGIHDMALNPFARFIAGLLVAYISTLNVTAGSIALLVVFFWIADVHLLSFSLFDHNKNAERT